MHPSLVHRYGLQSEADVALAEHLLESCTGLGISEDAADRVLEFYGTHVAGPLGAGAIDANAALHQLVDFARNDGIAPADIKAMVGWWERTGEHLNAHGTLPLALGRGADLDGEQRIADEIQQIMQTDPGRYWSSPRLQNRLYIALERLETEGRREPTPVAQPEHLARLRDLEGMMGDPMGAYWRGSESGALQSEYRNILAMTAPDDIAGALPAPGADAAA